VNTFIVGSMIELMVGLTSAVAILSAMALKTPAVLNKGGTIGF
jgi:hypothetical protein